ncbi:glycosyltransferase family 2 protein [Methylibium sp.]|uniref:glycosyltransferase family 2 protein n=1 Tax=Methylibium sp. TaxID=2067992 RepID=UPI003D0CAD03
MNLPTISIVTISFNQAPFLEECLRSVMEQDYPDIDYIVVDPGSTDGSREIIGRYATSISAAVLEPDKGPAHGLKKGFARARGSVFAYVNADDRLLPGALRFVGEYFAAHEATDVLCGAIRIVDREGRAALRRRTADRFDLARYAAGVCTVGQQGTFFRRRAFEAAGGFNVRNHVNWDGELLVDMALTEARFATVSKVLGDFRIHGESITGSNRFAALYQREHVRIAEKIGAWGVPLYSPQEVRLLRNAYRFNPLRHLRYLLAR